MSKDISQIIKNLGIQESNSGAAIGGNFLPTKGAEISSLSPVDGSVIAKVTMAESSDYNQVIAAAQDAFKTWRLLPAPKRGEIVRQFGEALRVKDYQYVSAWEFKGQPSDAVHHKEPLEYKNIEVKERSYK